MARALRQPVRFCLVGAGVFAFDFTMLWLLHHVMPELVAVSIAYFLAVTLHFCLNKWWVFEAGRTPAGAQIVRYLVTVAVCWACTVAVVWLARQTVTGHILVAKALAIPPTTVLGFLLMRLFVFRPPST